MHVELDYPFSPHEEGTVQEVGPGVLWLRMPLPFALDDGERTAAELLPVLFAREFNDYQLLFAMGETIAYLNHLWHRGALRRVAAADGTWRYVRAQ